MNRSMRAGVRVASLAACFLLPVAMAVAAPPVAGPNVNMVSGTKWPQGDPFLTKQNEPSIAVSSRNSRHLMAGANDYRLVPVEIAEQLDDPEAWVQVYKSIDGGATWRATPLGGCPINIPECTDSTGLTAALRAKKPNFGADPTVRPGPYGTFFLSFIAGTRDSSANGVVAVQRFVDKNNDIQRATDTRACTAGSPGCVPVYDPACTANCAPVSYVRYKPAEDPILPDVLNILDIGTPGQGKDKPWIAVDVGRRSWNGASTCELLSWTKGRTDVSPAAETVGAFNVYVSYANFTGNSSQPDIYVTVSKDCGNTFGKPIKLSSGPTKNQGTSSAIDPITGAVYVVWRQFANPGTIPPTPDAIMLSKSTDGGKTWNAGKVPIRVATFNPYDQGATGVSFRTLDFPSVALSVDKNGASRVHVAWSQRTVAPSSTAPYYACPAANPGDCDARIVVATSADGGQTFGAPKAVDANVATPSNPANPNGRGHQVQASLTFAAGKLLATWLDQRQDHTEGVLQCPAGQTCNSASDLVEVRRAAKNSNLDPACHIDISKPPLSTLLPAQKDPLDHCYNPAAVWTTFITDGSPGLVRRHTLDAFTAMADPADAPSFVSNRVSQYAFGNTARATPGTFPIVQKEVNAPNLPMFSNGKSAFIGDYIDSAGQLIVATGDPTQPYKFNAGVSTNGFVTGGFAPAFHVAFTDNRDVIPPSSGNWTTPSCLTSTFKKDPVTGSITGVQVGATCGTGYAGNRNQNVYTAAITEHSVAFAGANSKLLDSNTPRSFVVTVRNLSDTARWYALTIPGQPAGGKAAFKVEELSGTAVTPAFVFVQSKSAAARTVWAKSSNGNTKVTVQVASLTGAPLFPPSGGPPSYTLDTTNPFSTLVLLNPDANAPLVSNGDGGGPQTDTAVDSVGNVVLSNAVLTNNVLSNNALTNNALSNNALTNAVLSNVVLSNAVLTNLDPANAALSNDPLSNNALTNNALSNVVLSNVALTNNALTNVVLSNAVLSNVVLSNNTLNAALTNLDPANVALSNAVLSNNALTNVALSNNALSNVMLTNNALTNAVLSNVVLSNVALSNNALSNNVLSNVALSNAPLGDGANGGDPEALSTIETGSVEIGNNSFQPADLANSNFKETTFTIRNRGNTDTILAIKLMLRDAVCGGSAGYHVSPYDLAPYQCVTPAGYKLQLVLRKVALVPVAIPPTGPAVDPNSRRDIRIGIAQVNTEVSNTSDLPLIDPADPNFGKFLPDDPNAAMLSLAAGEYAYATIRAIGVGGASPPDPADLLQWGVKTVATNATNANGPLLIRTLSFPSTPAVVALDTATPTFRTFGGIAPITAAAVCADKFGNPVLNGVGAPASNLGVLGNFYIDTAAQTLYGPRTSSGWPAGTSLIANGPNGPQASVPCPPGAIAMGEFTTDALFNSTATVTFTPKYWGDFYMLANVADASAPPQTDRQVIKVTVLARPPVLNDAAIPATLTYNTGVNLRPLATSDSKNGAGVPQPIVFGASGSCHMADADNLAIDRATVPIAGPADCIVTVHQDGNEIYAPVTHTKAIYIDRATQTINPTQLPVNDQLTYNNNSSLFALVASVSSTTAPNSGFAVTYTSSTPSTCTTGGANGSSLTIVAAGTCTITADQAGDPNYKPAPTLTPSFTIRKANQNITFNPAPSATYNTSFMVGAASSASPNAPPSGIPIVFSSLTTGVCTVNGSTVAVVTAGTCTIAANQDGNGNYNAAPQVTQDITIAKAAQAITFGTAPTGVTFGDAPVVVSATSASPTAPPSNIPIVLSSQTTSVCTNVGTTVTILAHGTCTIAANQTFDNNYNAAPQVTQSFEIAKAKLYAVATVSPTSITYGDDVAPNAVPIVYSSSPSGPGVCLLTSYTATLAGQPPTTPANAGTYTISAAITSSVHASCDVLHVPPNDATLTVNKAPVQFVVDALYFTDWGLPTSITGNLNRAGKATIYPSAAPGITLQPANGTLTSSPPGGTHGTFTATSAAPPILPSTTYTLTFTFAGDGNFLAATPVTAKLRVEGFSTAGAMTQPRARHRSVLLDDGRVLIAGGFYTSAGAYARSATSEVYCPDTMTPPPTGTQCPNGVGAFSPIGNNLNSGSDSLTLTKLLDGKVLKVGGKNAEIEIFDPATNTWTLLPAALTQARAFHQATLLTCTGPCSYNGKVLITGGDDGTVATVAGGSGNTLSSTWIFDPATSTLSAGPAMSTRRDSHSATALVDGRVLIAGGEQVDLPRAIPPAVDTYTALSSAEIYDPSLPACGPSTLGCMVPAPSMLAARYSDGAVRLPDGKVLVAGGSNDPSGQRTGLLASAEIYDPGTNTWSSLPAYALHESRRAHTLTLLEDGWPLAIGGFGPLPPPADIKRRATSELFDIGLQQFDLGASLAIARARHRATRLPDGRVLITGGTTDITGPLVPNDFVHRDNAINSAEFYNGPPPTPLPPPGLLLSADPGGGAFTSAGGASVTPAGYNNSGFLLPTLTGGNENRHDGPYVAANAVFDARNALTVAAWIRPDPLAVGYSAQTIVSKYENAPDGVSWSLLVGPTGLTATVYGDDINGNGSQGYRQFFAPYPVPAGVWAHVAFVYFGPTQQGTLYVNGVLQPTTTSGFSVPAIKITTTPVRVGAVFASGPSYTGSTNYFGGAIDEVRTYAVALAAQQILLLATMP